MSHKKPQPKADKGKVARRLTRLEDTHRRDLQRLKNELMNALHHAMRAHERDHGDPE